MTWALSTAFRCKFRCGSYSLLHLGACNPSASESCVSGFTRDHGLPVELYKRSQSLLGHQKVFLASCVVGCFLSQRHPAVCVCSITGVERTHFMTSSPSTNPLLAMSIGPPRCHPLSARALLRDRPRDLALRGTPGEHPMVVRSRVGMSILFVHGKCPGKHGQKPMVRTWNLVHANPSWRKTKLHRHRPQIAATQKPEAVET